MSQPAPSPVSAPAGEPSTGRATEEQGGGESTGTVLLAGTVNLAIAGAKAVGGLLSNSSAMLSESAHSVADTITEVLLFVALKRGHRPPDARHPFGYGRETYFWAFLASLATFVAGAGFSIYQGVTTIRHGEELASATVSYIVLGVSFVLEAISLAKAVRQVRGEARQRRISPRRYLQVTTDTTVKAVTLEDSAALVGLLLAGLGLFLEQITDNSVWDGIAAILIGVLLILVAGTLARANLSLLIGQAASPALERQLLEEIRALDLVVDVPFLLTSVIGPGQLVVAAKVDFVDEASAGDVERVADEAERRLVARHEGVRYVFLDPTAGRQGLRLDAPSSAEIRPAAEAG